MSYLLFVSCRHEPVRDRAHAGHCSMHGRRQGAYDLRHCDQDRSALVLAGGPRLNAKEMAISAFDVGSCLIETAVQLGASRPKNAMIGSELLFTVSPGFFDVSLPALLAPEEVLALQTRYHSLCRNAGWRHRWLDEERKEGGEEPLPAGLVERWCAVRERAGEKTFETMGRINPERIHIWAMTILLAVSERQGWKIACWRLDLDEMTPHLSVFIVPFYEKRTKHTTKTCVSTRHHFGKRHQLSALQDWIGEVCAPLGLRRGIPSEITAARHLKPVVYRRHEREKSELTSRKATLNAERAAFEEEMRGKRIKLEQWQMELADREAAIVSREAEDEALAETLKVREQELSRREISERTSRGRLSERSKSLEKDRKAAEEKFIQMDRRLKELARVIHDGLAVSHAILEMDTSDEAQTLRDVVTALKITLDHQSDIGTLITRWQERTRFPTHGLARPG
ncbi:plasmid recombination protein [Jiella marina]|uniref:plasmid recombination protein n=1 Tax=Jiella sp. LLJ827 TaxID=2917712 RepID=UPI002100D656|nr:hypothetical protein [Jiella sp. LLJ827]MCQ0989738.1 hypothetical protein [Jiella sp. LLJ827]